jgi:lysophospholipase L1-like esterase
MLKKIALSLVALLVSLLAAELLIRAVGAAPKIYLIQKGRFQLARNPKIGYEPAPLAYQGQEMSFYDYKGASNRLGYRDVDHAVAKPPGVYRIVVIGDSIAAGLKVDRFEDTFPAILSERLNAPPGKGKKVEVISLAVSGYNTQQEVETLKEKGLRYQPDLVLLSYSLSSREHLDGDILKTLLDAERQKGGLSQARANPYLMKSALYRFFRFRVAAPRRTEELPRKYLDLVSQDTVADYFGVLENLAREHRFQVLVAVFPRFTRNFAAYPLGDQHRFAEELAERHHFSYLDLIVPFDQCRKESPEPIEVDNFHPSARGHRCAAEALAGKISAELMAGR